MNKVIVITGPTAVGKTKLSIELAKKLNGEIINADSTQIYKDLDIATAKVTSEEMEGIPHHLINIKNIDEDYSVYDYQKDCRHLIDDILKRKKTPILVGGTGFYIKSALYNYKFTEHINKKTYEDLTNDELYEMVLNIDKNTRIHKNNRKRMINAINYYNENNDVISNNICDKLLYDTIFIGLTTNREILYERINDRVDQMLKNGLEEEAKKIYNTNIRSKAVMTPIGYKELFLYFDGELSLEDAISLIKQRSRNYAKKQYTWFNNKMSIKWFDVNFDNFNFTIEEVYSYIKNTNSH